MFEKLDGLPWSSIEQAHGTSEHVPAAIRGLVSENELDRKKSYWKLDNYVVLQSDLYEAAFYTVPFLIEVLRSDILVGREYIYNLLFEIANGHAPEHLVVINREQKMPLMEACRSEIGEHLDLYLNEVQCNKSEYRNIALELLSLFLEHKDYIVKRLLKILEDDIPLSLETDIKEVIGEFE